MAPKLRSSAPPASRGIPLTPPIKQHCWRTVHSDRAPRATKRACDAGVYPRITHCRYQWTNAGMVCRRNTPCAPHRRPSSARTHSGSRIRTGSRSASTGWSLFSSRSPASKPCRRHHPWSRSGSTCPASRRISPGRLRVRWGCHDFVLVFLSSAVVIVFLLD